MTPILILAAGSSSRMNGRDKLAEPVDGVPLLRHLAFEALQTGEPVFVALPRMDHPRSLLLEGLNIVILACPNSDRGMATSLREAVAQLPDCDRFLVLAADLPELTTQDMAAVISAPSPESNALIWRATTATGKPGHPVLFDNSIRSEFLELDGDEGGKSIIATHGETTEFESIPENRALCDLDTIDDWNAWRKATGR